MAEKYKYVSTSVCGREGCPVDAEEMFIVDPDRPTRFDYQVRTMKIFTPPELLAACYVCKSHRIVKKLLPDAGI